MLEVSWCFCIPFFRWKDSYRTPRIYFFTFVPRLEGDTSLKKTDCPLPILKVTVSRIVHNYKNLMSGALAPAQKRKCKWVLYCKEDLNYVYPEIKPRSQSQFLHSYICWAIYIFWEYFFLIFDALIFAVFARAQRHNLWVGMTGARLLDCLMNLTSLIPVF